VLSDHEAVAWWTEMVEGPLFKTSFRVTVAEVMVFPGGIEPRLKRRRSVRPVTRSPVTNVVIRRC
jgi:hypothetical protein